MLGSRHALRAVHRGVRGVDQADVPPVPAAHRDQSGLGGADGGVRGLTGHGGLGEELRTEVFDSNDVVVADHLLRPLTAGVLTLPGGLLVGLGPQFLRLAVALRCRLALLRPAAGHHPVVPGQLLLSLPAVPGVRQVVRVGGGGRSLLHTPVDTEHTAGLRQRLHLGGDDEGAVPVPEAVLVHAHRGRLSRQFPRPHHPHHDPARQMQPAVPQAEPALGVVQGRQRLALLLVRGHPGPACHGQALFDVLVRLGAAAAEVADDLLLDNR